MTRHLRWYYRYVVKNKVRRSVERATMFVAWHLVPRYLRMWVVVRAFADATTCEAGRNDTPDDVGYSKVMERAFPR